MPNFNEPPLDSFLELSLTLKHLKSSNLIPQSFEYLSQKDQDIIYKAAVGIYIFYDFIGVSELFKTSVRMGSNFSIFSFHPNLNQKLIKPLESLFKNNQKSRHAEVGIRNVFLLFQSNPTLSQLLDEDKQQVNSILEAVSIRNSISNVVKNKSEKNKIKRI